MSTQKATLQRKRLSAIFVSFTIVIMGTASLLQSMSLDYYSVLCTLQKVIPASIILGCLGWVMGMVLDKPRRRSQSLGLGYNKLFINEVMKDDIAEKDIDDIEEILDNANKA